MADAVNAGAPSAAPVKRLSGLLIFSTFLTALGLLPVLDFFCAKIGVNLPFHFPLALPIIGPIIAVVLAWFGRARALRDPNIVGPRFGAWCLGLALLSLPLQGLLIYITMPGAALGEQVAGLHTKFLRGLEGRDWAAMYSAMSPEYRRTHTQEDLAAEFKAAFPGEEKIVIEGKIDLRKDEFDIAALSARISEFLDGEGGRIEFLHPCRIDQPEATVDMDMTTVVERKGRVTFEAHLESYRLARVAKAPAAPGEPPVEKPPEAPSESVPEKPVESGPEETPR
ncbi:MAG: hypothetical protein MUE73_17945 [Planctomycetes bacterium]|jgi:hypothetical protein|nr:hypothetical protein [Planctomycetota bacterium]